MKAVLFVTLALLVAACATNPSSVVTGPPAYKDGYAGGCDSGLAAGSNPYYHFTKDPARYLAEPMYKQGWDDGFNVCKSQYDAIGR